MAKPFGVWGLDIGQCALKALRLEMVSARIFRIHEPAAYEAKRRYNYEFHLEYLRCGVRFSPIDHPSLTAGPLPAADEVAAFWGFPCGLCTSPSLRARPGSRPLPSTSS